MAYDANNVRIKIGDIVEHQNFSTIGIVRAIENDWMEPSVLVWSDVSIDDDLLTWHCSHVIIIPAEKAMLWKLQN